MRYTGPTQYVKRMIELHGDQRTAEEKAEDEAVASGVVKVGSMTVTTRVVDPEQVIEDEPDAADATPEDLDSLTLVQLQAHARQAKVSQQGTKAEIKARILEKQGARTVLPVNADDIED